MLDATTVSAVATAVYVLTAVGLAVRVRGAETAYPRVFYAIIATLVVAAVTTALATLGLGQIPTNGTTFDVPAFVDDMVAYPILWAITVALAGLGRREVALVVAIPIVQRVAFEIAALTGGALAAVGALVTIGGHVYLFRLLRGRVADGAETMPEEQRLLHWKAWNLLWFLVAMLIVFAVLSLAGVYDLFVLAVLNAYLSILIRVAFALFLVANVDAVEQLPALDGWGGGRSPSGDGGPAPVSD